MHDNGRVQHINKHEGESVSSPRYEFLQGSDSNSDPSIELALDKSEQISLVDKLMMGCGLLALIIPVIMLLLALILFAWVQQA